MLSLKYVDLLLETNKCHLHTEYKQANITMGHSNNCPICFPTVLVVAYIVVNDNPMSSRILDGMDV